MITTSLKSHMCSHSQSASRWVVRGLCSIKPLESRVMGAPPSCSYRLGAHILFSHNVKREKTKTTVLPPATDTSHSNSPFTGRAGHRANLTSNGWEK